MAEQNNTGKILLIAGIVLGIAAGGMGAYTMSNSKVSKLNVGVSSSDETALSELSAKVSSVERAVARDVAKGAQAKNFFLMDVSPKGAAFNGKKRFTPLFYAPELWQISVKTGNGNERRNVVTDIYDSETQNIHDNVPNEWFLTNGLQEVMGQPDALTLDSDGDGFTNADEFAAKTSPTDATSFPALVGTGYAKLEVVKVTRERFVVQIDSIYDENPDEISVKLFRRADDPQPVDKPKVKKGGTFTMPGTSHSFTVLGFERKTYDGQEEIAVQLKDDKKQYVVRTGSVRSSAGNAREMDRPNEKGLRISDSSASLRVTAGPKAGTVITVAEGDDFVLPAGEGKGLTCTLKTIDKAGTVNIKAPGVESEIQIPKAAAAQVQGGAENGGAEAQATEGGESPAKAPKNPGKKPKKPRK